MFSWLFKKLGFHFVAESDRKIYRYWDGAKQRGIDPIVALLAIENHPTYRGDVHPTLVDAGDPEATRITVQMVHDVFGVQGWSENKTGLTVLESLALLVDFCNYTEAVKKNIEPSPISPPSTNATSEESSNATTSV